MGEVRIIPEHQAELIACYVPDLLRDVIEPLQAAGYEPQEIQNLGQVS